MATDIKRDYEESQAFTITLGGLANGSGRQSTILSNTGKEPAALVYVKVTSHASTPPTGGTFVNVYLLRGDGTIRDDGAGTSDAALTVENAQLLGQIVVTATANKAFYGVFDTAALGALGQQWGIAIKNGTGQSLHATEANHAARFAYHHDQIQ